MADLATLQIAVDSRPVAKASGDLDELGRSAKAAESASYTLSNSQKNLQAAFASSNKAVIDATKYINQLQDETRRMSMSAYDLKKYEIAMAAAAAPTVELKNQVRLAGAEMLRTMKSSDQLAPSIRGTGETAKLSRHHIMNLGYQFQDLFVSLASGQKPTTVFIQQGSQIGSVMADAGVGIGGMVKQLGGMLLGLARAHPVITAVIVAGTALWGMFQNLTSELSKTAKLNEYAKSLGLTEKEMKKLGPTSVTAMDAIKGIWRTIDEGLGLSEVFNTVSKWFSDLFSKALGWAKDAAMNIYGAFAASFDSIVYIWKNFPRIIGDVVISGANLAISGVEGLINRAIDAMNGLAAKANAVLKLVNLPTIPELDDVQIGRIANSYAGAATSIADVYSSSFAKRTAQAAETLKAVGDTFSDNIIAAAKDRIDKSAKDIISQRAEEETKAKAGKAGKDAGDEFSKQFADALEKNMSVLSGVYGEFGINARIKAETDSDIADMMGNINKARNEAYTSEQKALKENYDFAVKGAADIAALIGGSFGAGFKEIVDTLAKEFPKLVADLGGTFKGLRDSLDGFLASLGTNLKEVGIGVSLGASSAKMTGGSQVAGTVGGVLGQELGKNLGSSIANAVGGSFGKLLGSAAGPLGAIAGGILGGIIGGLFKKTKQASATISAVAGQLDVAGIVGNNAEFKQTANTLAGAVIGGINQIAKALGAEITNGVRLSIGQRDKDFVVDTLGQNRTKGSGTYKFKTEAEAIEFALNDAIRKGIFGGIKDGTERLLKGYGDLEERVQKAADFEGVFTAMKASADPFTEALSNLDARFRVLIETFNEAAASSEDWATLEQYYQQERVKAVEEGNKKAIEAVNAARDQLTEAYNRESEAILTTLERFKNLTADLESFRLSLAEQLMTAEEIYKAAKTNFDRIATLAAEGNQKALDDLIAVSQKYLDASKNFLTPEEYSREIQNVMKAVDLAIVQTKTMEDYAQLQLDALNNSVDGLITLNDSVLSVKDAIAALQDAMSKVQTAPPTTLVFERTTGYEFNIRRWLVEQGLMSPEALAENEKFAAGGIHSGGLRLVGEQGPELEVTGPSRIYNANQTASILSGGGVGVEQQIANLREEMRASLYAIAKNTGKTSDQLQRWDGDGLPDARGF